MRVYDNGSRPQLIVFDLDGTLYPRESYTDLVLDVMAHALVELNGLTPQAALDRVAQLRQMMATNWDATSTTAFILAQGVDARQWQQYRSRHLEVLSGGSRES